MISLDDDDCDACMPEYMVQRGPIKTIVSALPFLLTFLIVALGVSQKLFPALSGHADRKAHHSDTRLPGSSPRERPALFKNFRLDARSLAAVIFSINIALSAVLAELIFCEITSTGNRATRALALKFTLPSLLFLLVVATPALEIHSVVSGAGWSTGGVQRGQRKVAWVLEGCGLAIWLAAFWYLGSGLLGTYLHEESYVHDHTFSEGCLERIGVVGISMMASLTGFAAVSSLWQTFGVKYRPVSTAQPPTTTILLMNCRYLIQTSPASRPASKPQTTCSSPKNHASAQLNASSPTTHKKALWAALSAHSVATQISKNATCYDSRSKASKPCAKHFTTPNPSSKTGDKRSSARTPRTAAC